MATKLNRKPKHQWRVIPEGWVEYEWVHPTLPTELQAGPAPGEGHPYVEATVKKMMEGKGYTLKGYVPIP